MPYACDAECGMSAVVLVTNLDNGLVVAYCPEHAGVFLAGLAEMFGEAVTGAAQASAEAATEPQEAPEAPEATNGSSRPKRSPKRRTAPETAPTGTEAPAPAAADSG